MSSYKRNNDTNRDNLFGGSSKKSAGPKHKRNSEANRDALFGSAGKKSSDGKSKPARKKPAPKPVAEPDVPSRGYDKAAKPRVRSTLSGAAKMAKLKEAEKARGES